METKEKKQGLVHHHLLFQGDVGVKPGSVDEEDLINFLQDLLHVLGMRCLIQPQVKLSHLNAWTGIIGIVTSHIAFHYWVEEQYVQLDVYSCKEFDKEKAIQFLKAFWKSINSKTIFIDRALGRFKMESTDLE